MNTELTKPLRDLEDQVRAARVRAVRHWVRRQTLRHIALCILIGLICALLTACGGGDPEDEERPCVIDGKTYKPEVCR